MNVPVLVHDSVVKLPPEANGAVVIGGSHAAAYAAYMSAKFGCRAAIHHDAGIGKDEAGVGGLAYAQQLGMAMAAVATASARIGDGADMMTRGVISRANELAARCGVTAKSSTPSLRSNRASLRPSSVGLFAVRQYARRPLREIPLCRIFAVSALVIIGSP